jgi:exonuclease VII large subunit
MLSRVHTLWQRERKQVEKIIAKMDFEKRRNLNISQQEDIREKARRLIVQVQKIIDNVRNNLVSQIHLIQASNPHQILKKGFTLVLDKDNRVIKSVNEFNQKQEAILKFHDGSTNINKIKEEQ